MKTCTNLLEYTQTGRDRETTGTVHGTPCHCCITIAPYFLLSLSKYMSLVINITITLSNKTGEDPKVRTRNILCDVLRALLLRVCKHIVGAHKTWPSIPFSLFLICNFLPLPWLMYNVRTHSTVWMVFFAAAFLRSRFSVHVLAVQER